MKLFGLIVAACLVMVAGCDTNILGRPVDRQPIEVKVVNIPTPDPRIAELESRIKALEAWAQRQGMKY